MELPQTVNPGTLLLEENPFVQIPNDEIRDKICNYCFKVGKVVKCSSCKYLYYCGKNCQRIDWKAMHKFECKLLKNYKAPMSQHTLLLARIILKLRNGKDKDEIQRFQDLDGREEMFTKDQMSITCEQLELLKRFFQGEQLPGLKDMVAIFGKCARRNLPIQNATLAKVGYGIYPGQAKLRHSCNPNMHLSFKGTTMRVHATKQIENFDWSKAFINYVNSLAMPKMRQDKLKREFFVNCQCEMCIRPIPETAAAACEDKFCQGYVDIYNNVFKCNVCKKKVSARFIKDYKEVMHWSKQFIESGNADMLEEYETNSKLLVMQQLVLHRYNIMLLRILAQLIDMERMMNSFKLIKKYGDLLIKGLRLHFGDVHYFVCKYEYYYSDAVLDETKSKFHYQKAYDQAVILFGVDGEFPQMMDHRNTLMQLINNFTI